MWRKAREIYSACVQFDRTLKHLSVRSSAESESLEVRGEGCVGNIFWKGQQEDDGEEGRKRKRMERRQLVSEC